MDIREVKPHGLIIPSQEEIFGVARIEWISAGFGAGESHAPKPWFMCPRSECQRRVAILYGKTDPTIHPAWACRTCLALCYPIEQENCVESHTEDA